MSRYFTLLILLFLLTRSELLVYGQLKAAFTSDTSRGCAPLVVKFKDVSTGNPTSWRWEMGDGVILYIQNPATTYFNPGTYTVKLVISNGSGKDSVIRTNIVEVYAPPVVNFSASQTSGCFPLKVQFSDLSSPQSGSISSWEWDFGDGFSSSESNPVHIYNTIGNYNVTLRIKNSNGCVTTLGRSNYIKISTGVKADFNFTTPASCRPPTPVQFNNSSAGVGPFTYAWDFGDGTGGAAANPSHTYAAPGVYTVKLRVANNFGCSDDLVKPNAITIGTVNASFTAPSSVCAGAGFSPVNTSNPIAVGTYWDFGDGQFSTDAQPMHVFSAPGDYQVKLVSDFGACKDSTVKQVKVLDSPSADFTQQINAGCTLPFSVAFSAQSPEAVSYKWHFGDGDSSSAANPSHTYQAYADFDVTLTVTNAAGCTNTIVKNKFVSVKEPLVKLINGGAGCAPISYEPTLDTSASGRITSYHWDFGDGQQSDLPNPSHIYANAGSYDISLSYTTAAGCQGSFTAAGAITTGNKPEAVFTANPRITCAFIPISFVQNSGGATTDQWYWEFGDGGTSILPSPTHFYQDTGFFSIRLIVWSNGCSDTLDIPDYVHINPPIAKFTDAVSCGSPLKRKFIDRSIGASSWFWDFGDGSSSTEQNPEHIFPGKGGFTVSLTVTNDTCEHTAKSQVYIVSEKADFNAAETEVCKNAPVNFSTNGIIEGNVTGYEWNYGDGISQSGPPTNSHIYTESGIYDVQLVITDVSGCTDTLKKALYISVDGPVAGFKATALTVCVNTPVVFTDTSSAKAQEPIVSWIWDYGDGAAETLSGGPFSHKYKSGGSYTVKLTVVDSKGCRDEAVNIGGISISTLSALFESPDSLSCTGKSVQFINQSQGSMNSHQWSFGNGILSSDAQPSYTYPDEGSYTIKLTVTDIFGCTDSLVRNNYIQIRNPVARFTVSDSVATCPPLVVNFTNQSLYFNDLQWDFGDGTSSAIDNPGHFYTSPGVYQARLIITSPGGCMDSVIQPITVRGPEGSFTYDIISGCEPVTIDFRGTTKDNASFIWDFNDGSVVNDDSILVHTYERRGAYVPKMILVDPQGCRVPIAGADTIRVFGADASFSSSQQTVCDSGLVSFTNSSVANEPFTSYTWSFGEGAPSLARDPSHFYAAKGVYPVQLVVVTASGCRDTALSAVPIKLSESPVVAITGPEGACMPAVLQFNGEVIRQDTSALQWSWDFGNGKTAAVQSPPPSNYTVAGDYTVRLIAVNSLGCADTAEKQTNAYPLPPVDAGSNQVICRGQVTDLSASGADSYQWRSLAGISCTDCSSPKANPLENAVYFVTGKNQFNCFSTDSMAIAVKQPIFLNINPGDTLCAGESMKFHATGAELYRWSPAAGLDNTSGQDPVATPALSTIYQVIGYDDANCFSDTAFVKTIVYPYPQVNAGEDKTIAVGSSTPLKANISDDVTNINWKPAAGLSCISCTEPVASPRRTTEYSVEVINKGGCLSRDELTIFVFCDNGNFFLPNTFSPNGDGINDVFFPRGSGVFTIKTLRIFNRWGEVIFEKMDFNPNDITKGWDGSYNKRPAPQDVYVYSIDLICENQAVINFKGNVALIR